MGKKTYEIKDHLGNVRSTFTDVILSTVNPTTFAITDIKADAKSMYNYYAFVRKTRQGTRRSFTIPNIIIGSSPKPNTYNATLATTANDEWFEDGGYRFGFNGQEKDNEVKGEGNSLDFGARIYDSRLGRWLSLDPFQSKYPGMSPYNFCGNTPTYFVDFDGKDYGIHVNTKDKTIIVQANWVYISYKIKDKNQAKTAANFWKSQNGKFEMVLANGDIYKIVFETNAKANDKKPEIIDNKVSNTPYFGEVLKAYNQESGEDETILGVAPDNKMVFPEDSPPSGNVIRHESGHNLGLTHSEKLMDRIAENSDEVTIDMIVEIIGRANLGEKQTNEEWIGGDCKRITCNEDVVPEIFSKKGKEIRAVEPTPSTK
jgi:RHS repeat-associated protein